jgi:hypothetical protein
MICSGKTSNFAFTPSRSSTVPLIVLMQVIFGSTSWAMSLSPVEMSTLRPCFAAVMASVPMTSSASTPVSRRIGRPWPRTASNNGWICERRSSGIGGRCALYSANNSSRNVLPGASNTTAMRSGS